ncbi:MAG TPA: hypothetical protein VE261_04385 [Gaiellaceae bacterium]|nr:hypothetical protein [Gaiellaceae bacterium]
MTYREEVERLLEQIRERVGELRLLKTYGVRTVALEERKRELTQMRERLAGLLLDRNRPSAHRESLAA